MKCNFFGFEKNVSKAGREGYIIYLTIPVGDSGKGIKPLQVYSFGKWSYPYLSPEKAAPFMSIEVGTEVDLLFDNAGRIDSVRVVHK